MAERILSDAKLQSASFERDGHYLPDGGGLRIRLKSQTKNGDPGAKLAEYHFKIKTAAGYRHGVYLGTVGEPFTDSAGKAAVHLADARAKRDEARELVGMGIDPREAGLIGPATSSRRSGSGSPTWSRGARCARLRQPLARAVSRSQEQGRQLRAPQGRRAIVADLFERHILPAIGDRRLEEIRRGTVAEVLDRITAAGKRRTANMALSLRANPALVRGPRLDRQRPHGAAEGVRRGRQDRAAPAHPIDDRNRRTSGQAARPARSTATPAGCCW